MERVLRAPEGPSAAAVALRPTPPSWVPAVVPVGGWLPVESGWQEGGEEVGRGPLWVEGGQNGVDQAWEGAGLTEQASAISYPPSQA